jgi:hypothetical protein
VKSGDTFDFVVARAYFSSRIDSRAFSGVTILRTIPGVATTNEKIGETNAYTRTCDSGHLFGITAVHRQRLASCDYIFR